MSRLKNLRPATLIAFVALLVALGGTAYAANLITGKDIKANTITSPKIKNKSLKSKDLSDKTIADLKGATGPGGRGWSAGRARSGEPGHLHEPRVGSHPPEHDRFAG